MRSFQNYTDYFKCISAKGEDFAPCKQFRRAYHSLCPSTSSLKFLSFNFCINLGITRCMGMLISFHCLLLIELAHLFADRKVGRAEGKWHLPGISRALSPCVLSIRIVENLSQNTSKHFIYHHWLIFTAEYIGHNTSLSNSLLWCWGAMR
jgi:hypothetical protein